MTRGRKPKPSHLKVIQGNPGGRPLNKTEPRPTTGKPRCPSFLTDEAKAEWRRITAELEDLGLLSKVDRPALVLYCEAWATWREATAQLDEKGLTCLAGNGALKVSPYVSIRNKAFEQMRKILVEFGLTPSSRARVTLPEKEEEDPFAKFLNRR